MGQKEEGRRQRRKDSRVKEKEPRVKTGREERNEGVKETKNWGGGGGAGAGLKFFQIRYT